MHLIFIKRLNKSVALAYKNLQGKLPISQFDNLGGIQTETISGYFTNTSESLPESILNQGELRISQR